MLTPRLALAFPMAFHELATHAVKYGALTNEVGHILLDWDVLAGSPARMLRPVCPLSRGLRPSDD